MTVSSIITSNDGITLLSAPSDDSDARVWEGRFTFGIYLGGTLIRSTTSKDSVWADKGLVCLPPDHRTRSMAFVLDSRTMKYGWVQRKWLVRVE